MGVFVY